MEIQLTLKNYRCFSDTHPARLTLRPGRTALVGANNAGKSSLLRFFFEFRPFLQQLTNPNVLTSAFRGSNPAFNLLQVADHTEVFADANKCAMEIEFSVVDDVGSERDEAGYPYADRLTISVPRNQNVFALFAYVGKQRIEHHAGLGLGGDGAILTGGGGSPVNLSRIMSAVAELGSTHYIGPFRNALNLGRFDNYFDIKAGQAFVESWRELKTGVSKSQRETTQQITGDIRDIFGFESLEINASQDATTLQLFVNRKPFRLAEVGAGITQFIIVLVNAALQKPAWILIDEPELNLHPALQSAFLMALERHAGSGLIFATHSLGLARTAQRVFALHRIDDGVCEVRNFDSDPRLAELLGEMSFAAYQEVGYEQILLVEGPTDMKTFRQFLRWRNMDHLVVPMPLGGNGLIKAKSSEELAEFKRLCNRVTAVIDSERGSPDAPIAEHRLQFQRNCEALGIRCHILERRATENYLAERAIRYVKGEKYSGLGPYERLGSTAWGKDENWKIAAAMTADELAGTDLGQFLAEL